MDKDTKTKIAGAGAIVVSWCLPIIQGVPTLVGIIGTLIGFGIIAYPYLPFGHAAETEPHNPNDLRDTSLKTILAMPERSSSKIASWPNAPSSIDEKISIQLAILYILDRKWPRADDNLPEMKLTFGAINDIRMAAAAEKLRVFGVEFNGQIPAAIDFNFWISHQISLETVFQPKQESVKTESAISLPAEKRYKNLQLLKSEVEALWPPAHQQASTGPIASLTAAVSRPPQPMRDAARLAFEAIQGNSSERLISELNPTPEARLGYFMSDMAAQELRHYGKRPPASVAIQIPIEERARLHEIEGKNELIGIFETVPEYIDVTVDGDDLRTYLDNLGERFP